MPAQRSTCLAFRVGGISLHQLPAAGLTAASPQVYYDRCVRGENHVLSSRDEGRIKAERGAAEGDTRSQGVGGLRQQCADQPESYGPRFGAASYVLIRNTLRIKVLM